MIAATLVVLTLLARSDTLWLQNNALRLGFDSQNGALVSIVERTTNTELLTSHQRNGVFRIDPFTTGDSAITAGDARDFRYQRLNNGLRLTWRSFPQQRNLRVTATVTLRGAMSDWQIVVDSIGALKIEQVRFPRIEGLRTLGDDELAVPRWMGALARNPNRLLVSNDGKGRRMEFAYPGTMSLQMIAWYKRGGAGLYASSDDTLAYRKTFALWGDSDGTHNYELVHPLENPGSERARWSPRYAASIGAFTGDWLTAAERYRAWGTQQNWAKQSRLRTKQVPAWLTQTGMWVWNRGRSPGVVPPALALQQALGLPVNIYWHWWHHGPYDTSFPDYLPPREGVDSFKAAVQTAHDAGMHAMVYMNQRLWCINTPSWKAENAERFATKEKDGKTRLETYNIFDPQQCATMDVTTPFWRAKYAGIADTVLAQYKIDGIYMDQAVQSLVCWDPSHGHPLGGGNYWMGGFRKLAHQIRTQAGAHTPLLAGEGAGELWMPDLDLMLTLQVSQERYTEPNSGWDPIPFFQAVYHPYAVTYGNYSSLVMPPYDELWPAQTAPAEPLKLLDIRFRRQFYLEQARSFVWGLQPTIANFRASLLTDRPTETAYMMNLARIRARTLDYLLYGTFLRAPELQADSVDVDLSRISIYAAQRSGPTISSARYPGAIAGAWRAPNGRVAIAVASIVDAPTTVTFNFDPRAHNFSSGGEIIRIDATTRTSLGRFSSGRVPIRLELPAGGAYVVEFVPHVRQNS